MPADERDRQFERALQRHLRGGAADAACPDAETLAACHEHTLSLEEMTKWKEHMVTCSRCQETLALLEETNSLVLHEWEEKAGEVPAEVMGAAQIAPTGFRAAQEEELLQDSIVEAAMPAAAQKAARPGSTWRWIAPVGALAAGLLVFVAVRERKSDIATAPTPVQIAENQDIATPHRSASEQRLNKQLSNPARTQEENKGPVHQKKDTGALHGQPGASVPRAAPSDEEVAALARKEADTKQESMNALRVDANPFPAAPVAALRTPKAGAVGGAARAQSQVAAPKSSAPAPAPATENDSIAASADRAVAQTEAAPARMGSYISVLDKTAAPQNIIRAAGGTAIWRVGRAGKIELSIDLGKAWTPQNSGVNSDLVTGSAPSEKVCWVVGKAGTMLMTVDGGTHWKQIVSPIQGDLGGVLAIDAQHATVWAGSDNGQMAKMKSVSGNRGFQTADGGASWTPVASE